jgi:hypothetical protein
MIVTILLLLALGLFIDVANIRLGLRRARGLPGPSAFPIFPALFYVGAGALWHVQHPRFGIPLVVLCGVALHVLLTFGVFLLLANLMYGPRR